MNSDRPISLPIIGGISLPLAAIASITHRITGIVLFAGVALLMYLLDLGLSGEEGFAQASAMIGAGGWVTFLYWATLVALAYHVFAGIKHLLLDFHIGDTVGASFYGSIVVIIATAAFAVWLGVDLW